MITPAYKTVQQNHAVSWSFPLPSSNGKEKDWESGFHYYGARYYWSETLTGWLSVDPMTDKYPTLSPYNYCAWNPVKLVDPDGRDTFLFNSNGKLKETIPAKGSPVGKLEQKNGSYICFDFADPMNDIKSVVENPDFRVQVVGDKEIKKFLKESKVNEYANSLEEVPWYMPYRSIVQLSLACAYLYYHSNAGLHPDDPLTLDFTCRLFLSDDILYVTKVDGKYTGHNGHNFGNFLWGASTGILGVPLWIARGGAHLNNKFISKDENGGKWDSSDDQYSIILGHKWARRNKE